MKSILYLYSPREAAKTKPQCTLQHPPKFEKEKKIFCGIVHVFSPYQTPSIEEYICQDLKSAVV